MKKMKWDQREGLLGRLQGAVILSKSVQGWGEATLSRVLNSRKMSTSKQFAANCIIFKICEMSIQQIDFQKIQQVPEHRKTKSKCHSGWPRPKCLLMYSGVVSSCFWTGEAPTVLALPTKATARSGVVC